MKNRVVDKPLRKAYEAPKLVVYGNVVDLTHGGVGRGRGKSRAGRGGRGGRGRGGGGRGHGGSRS
jgi:hypothetical protein